MEKRFPNWILAALVLFIGAVNAAADYWHLYFFIWWLDIPMHLLGGCWLALLFFSVIAPHPRLPFSHMDKTRSFLSLLAFVLVVAVSWEIFEWSTDRLNGLEHFDLVDTLSDIMNGLIGSICGGAFFLTRGYNQHT